MIKNENDLLGLLITIKNSNNDVNNNELLKKANLDSYSLKSLINKLDEKHHIIYTCDTTTITDLGINNYISPTKKFLMQCGKMLVLTIKELLVFLSGLGVGLLVNYFTHMFGW